MDLPPVGTLEKLILMLRAQRVGVLRAGDLTIELHPSAFTVAQPEEIVSRDGNRCECTHALDAEHGPLGCLLGCSHDVCARTTRAEAN